MSDVVPEPFYYPGQVLEQRRVSFCQSVGEISVRVELEATVTGFIPLDEFAWGVERADPTEFVSEGNLIDVVVCGFDAQERRASLSMKRLQPNSEWDDFIAQHPIGTDVSGAVCNVAKYGAIYVRLAPDIEGCIDVASQGLDADDSWDMSDAAKKYYRVGRVVRCRIISVNPGNDEISLSAANLDFTRTQPSQNFGYRALATRQLLCRQALWAVVAQDSGGTTHLWHSEEPAEAESWRPLGEFEGTAVAENGAALPLLRRAVPIIRLYEGTTFRGEREAARTALRRLALQIASAWREPSREGWEGCDRHLTGPFGWLYPSRPEAWLYLMAVRDCRWQIENSDPPPYRRAVAFSLGNGFPL